MARYCPITQCKVTYMFCQECDDRICKKTDFSNKNLLHLKEASLLTERGFLLITVFPHIPQRRRGFLRIVFLR